MLKSYITTLQADTLTVVCEPQEGHELAVSSLSVFGGANGGYITISIGEFSMQHSIAANGRIVFPFFMGVAENMSMKALANNDGVQVCISAEEFAIGPEDEPGPEPEEPDTPGEPEYDSSEPLTFTTETSANVALVMYRDGAAVGSAYYRYKNQTEEWSIYQIHLNISTRKQILSLKAGDILQFMSQTSIKNPDNRSERVSFEITGEVYASGNVQSLENYSDDVGDFSYLFKGCDLITAPFLIAKNGENGTCRMMYSGCEKLQQIPLFKFDNVNEYCFYATFSGCTSLEKAKFSFIGSPINNSLYETFKGCANLNEITVNFTEWVENATTGWVSGVSATGTFYKPSALPEIYSDDRIPEGWTVVNID